ncbi:hypothetical protein ACFLTD_04270, partial [Elusimicrobiota bacterium]
MSTIISEMVNGPYESMKELGHMFGAEVGHEIDHFVKFIVVDGKDAPADGIIELDRRYYRTG